MNRWTPLLLKATIFILVVAILGTLGALTRYALVDKKMSTPRTETERDLYLAVQAVKANPNDAKARIKLASVYLEMGRVNAAIDEAKTAAKISPNDPDALYTIGIANKQRGDLDEAVKSLTKATKLTGELAPFYQTCWLEIGRVQVERKDYKAAVRAYNASLGYGPESASILYELAKAYDLSGDKTNAISYYKEALEYVPDYQEALVALERLKSDNTVKRETKQSAAKAGAGK